MPSPEDFGIRLADIFGRGGGAWYMSAKLRGKYANVELIDQTISLGEACPQIITFPPYRRVAFPPEPARQR